MILSNTEHEARGIHPLYACEAKSTIIVTSTTRVRED